MASWLMRLTVRSSKRVQNVLEVVRENMTALEFKFCTREWTHMTFSRHVSTHPSTCAFQKSRRFDKCSVYFWHFIINIRVSTSLASTSNGHAVVYVNFCLISRRVSHLYCSTHSNMGFMFGYVCIKLTVFNTTKTHLSPLFGQSWNNFRF